MAAKEIPVLPLEASTMTAAGPQLAPLGSPPQDVQGHPVLDAVGHVHRLVLGVEPTGLAVEPVVDLDERRVADERRQMVYGAAESGTGADFMRTM